VASYARCGGRTSTSTRGVLTLRRAISQFGRERSEKDTKTHQRRRLTLDPETVTVLAEHW
jgi:integrase-like protein